jgi:hypothetical protein
MNGEDRVWLAQLDERLKAIDARLGRVESDTSEIKAQMNRWKGAAPVVLVLGGIVGWALTSWDSIKGLFR